MANTYTRGVLTTITGSLGYLQSIDAKRSAKEDAIQNAAGTTVDVAFIDLVNEVTAVVKFDRDATIPEIGSSATIAACNTKFNGVYYVMDCQLKEQTGTSCDFTVSLKRYVTGAIPAA